MKDKGAGGSSFSPARVALIAGVVVGAILLLAVVGGLFGGSSDESTVSSADQPTERIDLATPTRVRVTLVEDSCTTDEDTNEVVPCRVRIRFQDESEGESGHVIGLRATDDETDTVQVQRGDITQEIAHGEPVCVTVRAVAADERSEPSDPVCRFAVPLLGGLLVDGKSLVTPADLRQGQCAAPAPGESWASDSPWLRPGGCAGGKSGKALFVRPAGNQGADAAAFACQARANGDPSATGRIPTAYRGPNAKGRPTVTCVVHS